jgi:ketosteroid isomerase-like protein
MWVNRKKMKMLKQGSLLFLAIFATGCTTGPGKAPDVERLMDTDRAFSRRSHDAGMTEAFLFFCAEEGVMLRPDSRPVVGHTAIEELLEKNDDSAFELTWEPLDGKVSASGDLGYTYGLYTLKLKSSGSTSRGTYVSIWKMEDGSWKWVLDTGNDGLGD